MKVPNARVLPCPLFILCHVAIACLAADVIIVVLHNFIIRGLVLTGHDVAGEHCMRQAPRRVVDRCEFSRDIIWGCTHGLTGECVLIILGRITLLDKLAYNVVKEVTVPSRPNVYLDIKLAPKDARVGIKDACVNALVSALFIFARPAGCLDVGLVVIVIRSIVGLHEFIGAGRAGVIGDGTLACIHVGVDGLNSVKHTVEIEVEVLCGGCNRH